jgi:hypothetical protein
VSGSVSRYIRWAIAGVVSVGAGLVAFDVGGPFRSPVTLLAVLVAPGLAASLSMEAMPIDLRVVFSTLASAAIVMVATTAATVASSTPGDVLFFLVGVVTISLLLASSSKRTARFKAYNNTRTPAVGAECGVTKT